VEYGISGTKTGAWVAHILSLSTRVKKARGLEPFTERLHSVSKVGEPLDVTTRKRAEAFFGYNLEEVRVHYGHQAEEASRRMGARAFTFKGHIFGPRQNLDASTRDGPGLLAHELTHAIQQTQPHRRPQRQSANREESTVSATPEVHSDAAMVLSASRQGPPTNASPQQEEAQAQASEQQVVEGLSNETESPPQMNPREVADKVYRLMQYDLVLERERATRVGG
jgi:hypothetical protein